MSYNLLRCDGEQAYLMPPSLQEWVPEGDLAWFIVEAVDEMDVAAFYARYREDGWGAAAYDPKMMVAVLLYGYCQGMRSSRKIARALEREAETAAKAAQDHLAQRQVEEATSGKKKRGRKPRVVEASPSEEAKANTTDPDRRIMKTRQGYIQGYNVQAVVSEDQIIVAVGATQEANDVQQLLPMLERMNANLKAAGILGRPRVTLADAGYWSEANVTTCTRPDGPELLIATTKEWNQRRAARERGCPRGLSPRERMERKLLTKRGRRLYRQRSVIVEPVFGQAKEQQGFRRFMRRGLRAASSESALLGTTHNLLKLWRSGQAPWGWARARWN